MLTSAVLEEVENYLFRLFTAILKCVRPSEVKEAAVAAGATVRGADRRNFPSLTVAPAATSQAFENRHKALAGRKKEEGVPGEALNALIGSRGVNG